MKVKRGGARGKASRYGTRGRRPRRRVKVREAVRGETGSVTTDVKVGVCSGKKYVRAFKRLLPDSEYCNNNIKNKNITPPNSQKDIYYKYSKYWRYVSLFFLLSYLTFAEVNSGIRPVICPTSLASILGYYAG